jgi:hypothetical protein
MSETKPKKMVGRSVAIALGIICIILVAGLGVLFIQFQNQISSMRARMLVSRFFYSILGGF